jgi:hypothetical protein
MALLFFAGAPNTALLLFGLGASAVFAFRRPLISVPFGKLVATVSILSFVSWFSWDARQAWVRAPGMFRDELSSRFSRLTQVVCCFVFLDMAFIPSVHLWGAGEPLAPTWLWTSVYQFFLNLVLPALFILCALVATGARPLWMHLVAVEWAKESDELE